MSVLSQDAARQFLSGSGPEDKYSFFMKGTQLARLAAEMDIMREKEREIGAVARSKREGLPDLMADVTEKAGKFAIFDKAREQKKKLENLGEMYIWSQVKAQKEVSTFPPEQNEPRSE